MQIKERGFTEHFYLRKGENVYSFLRVAVLIWHLSIIERVRKKERMYTFEKTTVLVWKTNSTNDNFFSSTKVNDHTESIIHFQQRIPLKFDSMFLSYGSLTVRLLQWRLQIWSFFHRKI